MQSRKNKGFTLMEMLIVVAIIGVLVAMGYSVLSSSIEKTRRVTCQANRRSLYEEVVVQQMLDGGSYSGIFNSLVSKAGKCPSKGTFSWEEHDGIMEIKCSYHDESCDDSGGGSGDDSGGGSGDEPSGIPFHQSYNGDEYLQGMILIDSTGTYVVSNVLWSTKTAYDGGALLSELSEIAGSGIKPITQESIKNSPEDCVAGDVYHNIETDTYAYVTRGGSQYEAPPVGEWIPIIQ